VIECNNEQFICAIKSQLGLPMLYRTVMSIQEYRKGSGQFSGQQTVNDEVNNQRMIMAQDEYNTYMTGLMRTIRFPKNRCFVCNPNVYVETRLPG
jgi:hypothetical protein